MIDKVPSSTFHTRVRNDDLQQENPFEWKTIKSEDIFEQKKVVVFSIPGAYTPTCSSTHLPRYEELYSSFIENGIDDLYCLSVNDAFVMRQWKKQLGIKHVKMLPDGNAEFTRKMGMLVQKDNLGFGLRSWRYAMIINNGNIEQRFVEEGLSDDCPEDPFEVSDADTVLNWIINAPQPTIKPPRNSFEG